jgi:dTDP-4-dehydrorhamnose 3,5-epimerase-like enzyme
MNEFKVFEGGVFVDDRGPLRFVNDFDFKGVKRFYQVQNHERGFVRAWHGHKKEGKYVYVAKGSAWVAAVDMEDEKLIEKFVLSDKSPKILYIPPGYYNGFQTLEEDTIVIFFSTTTIEESKGDDYRQPYGWLPIFKKEYR